MEVVAVSFIILFGGTYGVGTLFLARPDSEKSN